MKRCLLPSSASEAAKIVAPCIFRWAMIMWLWLRQPGWRRSYIPCPLRPVFAENHNKSIMSLGFSVTDFFSQAPTLPTSSTNSFPDLQKSTKRSSTSCFVVHRVLLHVEQLRAACQLAESTFWLTGWMKRWRASWAVWVGILRACRRGVVLWTLWGVPFRKGKWELCMPHEVTLFLYFKIIYLLWIIKAGCCWLSR